MITHEKLNIPKEVTIENHIFTINLVESLAEDPFRETLTIKLRSKSTPQCINIALSRRALKSNTINVVNLKLAAALDELKKTLTSVHFEL